MLILQRAFEHIYLDILSGLFSPSARPPTLNCIHTYCIVYNVYILSGPLIFTFCKAPQLWIPPQQLESQTRSPLQKPPLPQPPGWLGTSKYDLFSQNKNSRQIVDKSWQIVRWNCVLKSNQWKPVSNSFLSKVICKMLSVLRASLLHFWGKCTYAAQPGWSGVLKVS